MASRLIEKLRDIGRAMTGKRRTGPFSPSHFRLALDLAHLRNRIDREDDAAIRNFLQFAVGHAGVSRSQIFQDALVLYVLGSKRDGFFCEFGSTDGVALSNSYCLERHFSWRGICAEPARNWHDDLKRNRPGAFIETNCVWTRSGETLSFSEARTKELSTISDFETSDDHARRRRGADTYEVQTISLNDLLAKYDAPADFDYLSMDTEGSELAILQAFDTKKWRPKVVTIEHNYTPNRDAIFAHMRNAGYRRVLPEISLFDDWYLAPGVDLPTS